MSSLYYAMYITSASRGKNHAVYVYQEERPLTVTVKSTTFKGDVLLTSTH